MSDSTIILITVEALVQAPVEQVWQCWTAPEHITQWNAASDDWHTPWAKNDLRVGGTFTSRMEARDGSMGFDFEGEYDEVQPLQLIRYHMADGRRVTIQFTFSDAGTHVSETFDAESVHSAELQRQGWQAILNRFKGYVEGLIL